MRSLSIRAAVSPLRLLILLSVITCREVASFATLASSLADLTASGELRIWRRPNNYIERRSDGYEEPLEVWVIGTNHRSKKSAETVERVLETLQPDATVIELCRSRVALLSYPSEEDGRASSLPFSGDGDYLANFAKSLKLAGGFVPLALRFAMAGAVDSTVGATADNHDEAPVGVDFRTAFSFTEFSGTKIVLGDRPIEITLARFVHALSLQERAGLFWALLSAITNKDVSSTKAVTIAPTSCDTSGGRVSTTTEVTGEAGDDAIASLSSLLKEALPNEPALAALTTERDSYLAWSLKRSRAVGGIRRVVGVVGRAHLSGVMAEMDRDLGGSVLSFQDLTARPSPTPKSRLLRLVWEIALWGSTGVLFFPDLVYFTFGE